MSKTLYLMIDVISFYSTDLVLLIGFYSTDLLLRLLTVAKYRL